MVQSAVVENDSDAFSVSLLAFWVKGSITLDDAFLRVNMPNTVFFGLVPAGKQKDSSPLSGITNVYILIITPYAKLIPDTFSSKTA
ncbi:hypothetical protein OGM84_08515 [Pediococcus acidilactici]